MKKIAIFNHKGGVAKTTTSFNIGWMMASSGKRTLLADFDPQCNLSWLSLGYKQDVLGGYPFSGNGANPKNIRDGLEPVFEARPIPMSPVECPEVEGCPGLFLMPGHIDMASYENQLGIAQSLSGAMHALQNIPGSISNLLDITAEKYNIDYIIIDMSPSLGPLNQNLLMSSDFFIVPMAPDYFADLAIKSLSKTLPAWKKWSINAGTNSALASAFYPWSDKNPKYLGAVIQNYTVRSGAPANAFQRWFDALKGSIQDSLVPQLSDSGMLLSDEKYAACNADPNEFLVEIKNYGALGGLSHEAHKPVFSLTDHELKSGGAVATNQRQNRDHFYEVYESGVRKIICMTS
jgi:cellulose biosynthesis protein BcsQ